MKSIRSVFLLITVLSSTIAFAQDKDEELAKQLSVSICKCLKEYRDLYNDSDLARHCYVLAIKETEGVPKSESKVTKLLLKADAIMQKDCIDYINLMRKLQPSKSDWEQVDSTAVGKLDSTQCRSIIDHQKLYYLEYNGDTTVLSLKGGYWQDYFQNGKYYSKCILRWLSGCEIEIEFLKSTEPGRARSNKKGDKYYYRILDKTDKYYLLLAHYGVLWAQFKVYYN